MLGDIHREIVFNDLEDEGFREMICCERIVRRFKAREEFEE